MIGIRKMTTDDIPRVAELEAEIFANPWLEKVYRETLVIEGVEYVVAMDEDEIIGAAGVRNILGTGEITNVMITPEYRRRGIGKMMIADLLERGRRLGIRDFTLEVRVSNTAAIRLYEGFGFKSAGIRPGYYINPKEDAYIYWLMEDEASQGEIC